MRTIIVPLHEVEFRTSRAGGPGGQNVNKVETRVEARWSVQESTSLTDAERERIRAALGGRLSGDGTLRVISQKFRTQAANRRAALERLRDLVRAAAAPRKARKKTGAPRSAHETRLTEKRRRALLKRERARGGGGGGSREES